MSKKILIGGEQFENLIPGESTLVPIVVQFDSPTKVRGIYAEFHGAEKTEATYTETSTDADGKSTTKTRTTTEHVDIAKSKHLLFGKERKGFFGRIGDSMATMVGGGDHELIQPGEQTFEIEISLPPESSPTFKGEKCEVFYRLNVFVDLPIKIDWSEKTTFEVLSAPVSFADAESVHVTFPDSSGRSFWDKTFGKDVTLDLALDQNVLCPGGKAQAFLSVETAEPLKIKGIDITLVGTEKVTANHRTDSHVQQIKLGQVDAPSVLDNENSFEFEIQAPEMSGPFSQSGTNFEVEWHVEVQLKIPWASDPVIKVPIRLFNSSET